MRKILYLLLLYFLLFPHVTICAQDISPAAHQPEHYLGLMTEKKTAIVSNHASLTPNGHLVDLLLKQNIHLVKIFSPEHGFRGHAGAGEKVGDDFDPQTGLPVISLYGKNKKPTAANLEDVELVIFDLQDVGTRFYTYISTLHYVMEACAENSIPLIILDRPNPNASYIDGPVLDSAFSSFVGMHPVPVVYGMTIGEYALMINGEGWLKNSIKADLQVIPCKGYTHDKHYSLPVAPSPNLPNDQAVMLYPSLCFFEGTVVSIGRGTNFPFQVVGHPDFQEGDFYFTPKSKPGYSLNPKHEGKLCRGWDLRNYPADSLSSINLGFLISAHEKLVKNGDFFNSFFSRLSGSDELQRQIENGMSEKQIRSSWQSDLEKFKRLREKYLLYP